MHEEGGEGQRESLMPEEGKEREKSSISITESRTKRFSVLH